MTKERKGEKASVENLMLMVEVKFGCCAALQETFILWL
jgi:hypothetical protein